MVLSTTLRVTKWDENVLLFDLVFFSFFLSFFLSLSIYLSLTLFPFVVKILKSKKKFALSEIENCLFSKNWVNNWVAKIYSETSFWNSQVQHSSFNPKYSTICLPLFRIIISFSYFKTSISLKAGGVPRAKLFRAKK